MTTTLSSNEVAEVYAAIGSLLRYHPVDQVSINRRGVAVNVHGPVAFAGWARALGADPDTAATDGSGASLTIPFACNGLEIPLRLYTSRLPR